MVRKQKEKGQNSKTKYDQKRFKAVNKVQKKYISGQNGKKTVNTVKKQLKTAKNGLKQSKIINMVKHRQTQSKTVRNGQIW